ncbi:Smr domain-containing protein [Mycoplasmopsis bovigenitalium]|uniref:Smr domain-containing protein n=1 Tax=Mycoplasmopsis bovigenitalium TaxID=2112 RepID=A0A449A9H4_9BACT|nr:Smr/MutS family protein [Mycoplasmopsis bovigenitalium]VEU60832.1 Smr domain-containing protein [Mycoplasmopsis bovigenitalium]
MSFKIDLHGNNVEQAISKLILGLFQAKEQDYDYLEIITGKGTGAMQVTVEQFLEDENLEYYIEREGCYIVNLSYYGYSDYID